MTDRLPDTIVASGAGRRAIQGCEIRATYR